MFLQIRKINRWRNAFFVDLLISCIVAGNFANTKISMIYLHVFSIMDAYIGDIHGDMPGIGFMGSIAGILMFFFVGMRQTE